MNLSGPSEDTPPPAAETAQDQRPGPPADAAVPPPADAARSQRDPEVVREQIRRRFDVWLYDVLSAEQPPEGVAAEILSSLQGDSDAVETGAEQGGSDLFSLWSAVTALTQETRLQGRAFKELHDGLPPVEQLGDQVASVLAAHEEALSTARETAEDARAVRKDRDEKIVQAAQHRAREEVLDLLLDMRDRLVRGHESARGHLGQARRGRPHWLARLLSRGQGGTRNLAEATEALIKGSALVLARLDEALEGFGVREIACGGLPFDPQRMMAVDVEASSDAPNGAVLEVYRAGYEWQGRVFRHAEVKVARRPGDPPGPLDGRQAGPNHSDRTDRGKQR